MSDTESESTGSESTEALVAAAQGGDREALDQLLARYLPGMQAFMRKRASDMLLERESAGDLAQSACRLALKEFHRFEYRGENSFRNWLLTFADNNLLNKERFVRAERRSPANEREVESFSRFFGQLSTPSVHLSAREQVELVQSLLAELRPDYRQVILMSKVQGLSHREIAAKTGKTEGATRVLLSRALVRFSVLLEEHEARDGS